MKKDPLTPEQRAQVKPWVDRWIANGLRTGETDWDTAETAVREMYDLAGLEQVPIEHVQSPLSGARIAAKKSGLKYHPWYGGQFWAGWAAFTSFLVEVYGWKPDAKIARAELAYRRLAESSCYIWPNSTFCLICARPTEIHMEDGSIHRDGGLAISWPDGWGVHCLHGVRVPKWLATDHHPEPARIQEIDNAEVRREFLRKVGVERLYNSLGGKTIDEDTFHSDTGTHRYRLVDLTISNNPWRYLWMENASIDGIFHMEGVPKSIETCAMAILWRAKIDPKMVSPDGADWYQQGDVVLIPKGAKKLKPFPKVLT